MAICVTCMCGKGSVLATILVNSADLIQPIQTLRVWLVFNSLQALVKQEERGNSLSEVAVVFAQHHKCGNRHVKWCDNHEVIQA